jgi:hypothetical protein
MRFSAHVLAFGLLLATPAAFGESPAPCQVLSAEAWGGVMGYAATATPGDMNCTYEGANKAGGGQLRILAIAASSAEAAASAKRMRDRPSKGSHDAGLSTFDSQGNVVFSIALFQKASTDATAAQLQKLVAAAKQHLPR